MTISKHLRIFPLFFAISSISKIANLSKMVFVHLGICREIENTQNQSIKCEFLRHENLIKMIYLSKTYRMAMTMKAAGTGYHKSANLATLTPSLGFIEVSKSDHVTFGGNQMSSFQNHWFKRLAIVACHTLISFLMLPYQRAAAATAT